ncbi:hypothetical protein HHK36_009540 [Tetracentron sinense]|uniref:Homeobox-leucine zipper protein n=1 Tax=Tetracentron sinense TaxID=13715 RepID=A0A834ZCZ9_TETSI|nr:hypothetical protein HHK36_009540 [Tetracentron sinense]
MKRLTSSDSMGALISICPSTVRSERQRANSLSLPLYFDNLEEKNPGSNHVYSRGFQSMLDGLDEDDCDPSHITEKKRRLSVDQVKALEKNFEVENKLEPERKVKLAQELCLQPRQVAVWFQNRRARWKTKQLERDYGLLKANYEALKLNYETVQHNKEALLAELKELKSKLHEGKTESNLSIKKKEVLVLESGDKISEQSKISGVILHGSEEITKPKHDCKGTEVSILGDFRDGSSDSDSSAILNEENSSNAAISSSGVLQPYQILNSPFSFSPKLNCCSSSSPSSINCFEFMDSKSASGNTQKPYQQQVMRMEEHNFFSTEETCDFFSDDQAPSLQWYCSDEWN